MSGQYAHFFCGKRAKWVVLVVWVAALVLLGPLAGKLTGAQDNQASSWLPASAESTKAFEQIGQFRDPDVVPAIFIYERKSGITPADLAKAKADAASFAKAKGLRGQVLGPIPSADKQALQTLVPLYLDPKTGWDELPDMVKPLKDTANASSNGMGVHLGGPVGFIVDQSEAFAGIDGTLLAATLLVVIVILVLTYRSPILWVIPLLSAVGALFAAQAVIYLLAEHSGLTVNAQSAAILTVLVIGAGTDYALLLVARYREELRRHEDRHEAMAFALHRSGPAIFASGGTVIFGMLCLVAAEMNSTKGLGPVAAIGIVFSLLAMLTLLPALLVIFGRWVFWPRKPAFGSVEPAATGLWAKVGNVIKQRPRKVWVTTAIALAICALGLVKLDANGLTSSEQFVGDQPSIAAAAVSDAHFSSNAGDPIDVIVNSGAVSPTVAALKANPKLSNVTEPVTKGGRSLVQASISGDAYAEPAFDTVRDVRAAVHAIPGTDAVVGGTSAVVLDTKDASTTDNTVIIPLTLVVVMLILMLLLRAVVAPLILIATVVLSFAAALGISSLVFEYVFGFGGQDASFPLFVFVFLVALGIDYNIFLMTRVREESVQHGTRRGSLIGLAATGGVITSAGFVLAATFAVLGSLPIVFIAELGFAVALGVLLDTIIVRAILVTAINLDAGNKIWWPSKLSKVEDEPLTADHVNAERVPVSG